MIGKPLAQARCLPQSTHLIKSTLFFPFFFSFQFPFNSMKNKYAEDQSGEMTEALAVLMEKTLLEKVLEGYAYGVK